ADADSLALAESAVALHAQVTGKSSERFLARSRVPGKLAEARGAVRRAEVRAGALAPMDAALRAGSSSDGDAARDGLIRAHPDLAEDRGLHERMTKANELVRRAVRLDASMRPAETEPRVDPLGPPLAQVVRATLDGSSPRAAGPVPPLAYALVDGFLYGLDALTGKPLWVQPAGLWAPFPPRPVPGSSSVLAFDARFDELVRLDGRTGALLWRQALGERVVDPPLILGNQLLQTTPGGSLLV